MSRSSSMACLPATSLAGACRHRRARTSCWTRWSRLALRSRQPRAAGRELIHHSDRGVQYVSIRYTGAPEGRRHRAVGGQRGRLVRQCAGRKRSTVCTKAEVIHKRGPWRSLPQAVRRTGDARMGRLVQQPSPVRTDRQYPAGRSRSSLLSSNCRVRHGGVTQAKQSPGNPGRFRCKRRRPLETHSALVRLTRERPSAFCRPYRYAAGPSCSLVRKRFDACLCFRQCTSRPNGALKIHAEPGLSEFHGVES